MRYCDASATAIPVRVSLKRVVMLTMIDARSGLLAEDFSGGPGICRDFVMLLQCRRHAAKTSFDVGRGPGSVRQHLAALFTELQLSIISATTLLYRLSKRYAAIEPVITHELDSIWQLGPWSDLRSFSGHPSVRRSIKLMPTHHQPQLQKH